MKVKILDCQENPLLTIEIHQGDFVFAKILEIFQKTIALNYTHETNDLKTYQKEQLKNQFQEILSEVLSEYISKSDSEDSKPTKDKSQVLKILTQQEVINNESA